MIVIVVMVMVMVVIVIVIVVMIVMICFVIVHPKQIDTKIVRDVPPHRMNVVCIVLRVIIFHKEKWTVQSIIVRCLRCCISSPCEVDVVDAPFS